MISKRTKKPNICTLYELALLREAHSDILRARPQEGAKQLPLTSSERELLEYFRDEIVRTRCSLKLFRQLSPQNQKRFQYIERAREQKLVQRQQREMEDQRREGEIVSRVVLSPEEEAADMAAFRLQFDATIAEVESRLSPRRPPNTPESRVLQRGDRVTITNPNPGQVATALVLGGVHGGRINLLLDDCTEKKAWGQRKAWRKRKNLLWNGDHRNRFFHPK